MADRPSAGLELDATLRLLREGALDVEGRLVDASNATLLCTVSLDGVSAQCVYKPRAGERPLWDFPDGTLAHREVAAYLVSSATGWEVVPPTVLRVGPFGPGMCQLWIDVDEDVDVVALARSEHPDLRRMVVFDAVVNNADRKGGHLLPTRDGHVYGVDHGVCFSVHDKLRTLLWQWRGQRLTEDASEVLTRLRAGVDGEVGRDLRRLLAPAEVEATRRRIERLLRTKLYPSPSEDWPAIPWPPF
ncbi:MAG TPA: SCO1664 family protein [Mycobacteriales bacterium]|nr:SCO1664 family protein [Mycobacteriales bacterium]